MKKLNINLKSHEKIREEEKRGKGVIDKKDSPTIYKHKCSKCGHENAEVSDLGLFYSDEDNVYLITCANCGHSERIGEVA